MPTTGTVGTPARAIAKTPSTAAAETQASAAKAAGHHKCQQQQGCLQHQRCPINRWDVKATPVTQQEQGWQQLVRFHGIYDQIFQMANIRKNDKKPRVNVLIYNMSDRF